MTEAAEITRAQIRRRMKNVDNHLFWQYRKGAFKRAERQQDERGKKQAL